MWIIYIILVVLLIIFIFAKIVLNMIFGKRCEGNPNLKYFTAEDFEELEAKKIEFESNKGQNIRGFIYTNKNINNYKSLVVFVHGMGAGHFSYTTEINTLVKNGFIVMSYDNTGTCLSEGKSLKGFFQSVIDLDNALKFIEEDKDLNKYDISLIGHSWGAYTVCQSLQFNHKIKSVVAFSGPNNSSNLICDLMGAGKSTFRFLKPFLDFINLLTFGSRANVDTIDILKKTDIPVLLLHGDLDGTCTLKNSLVADTKIFEDKKNIQTIIYKNKYHNVYQTRESEKYLNEVFAKINELNKKYKGDELEKNIRPIYDGIDYEKITEEDEEVMDTVINFLEE